MLEEKPRVVKVWLWKDLEAVHSYSRVSLSRPGEEGEAGKLRSPRVLEKEKGNSEPSLHSRYYQNSSNPARVSGRETLAVLCRKVTLDALVLVV